MPPLPLEFVTSAAKLDQLEDRGLEVAVVGRSNVGKSSLLNAIANRKSLAATSKQPGRTRLLNQFAEPRGALVDCPGYGYARVSKAERASWQTMIEDYLIERDELSMVMALIDGEVGPTKLDVQLLVWLRASEVPHTVIATKHDKVKSSARQRRKRELAERCDLETGDVVWTSADKGVGIDRVRDLIVTWWSDPV